MEELIKKLEKELADFKAELLKLPAEKILRNSYKLVCMETILDYLTYNANYLETDELKALLNRQNILAECYDDWLSNDASFTETMEYSINKTMDFIIEDEINK